MEELIQQGVQAYKSGNREAARKLLIAAVRQYPESEQAWGWMFNVCNTDQERIHCLNQVLRINPSNEKAKQLLDKYTPKDFPFEREPSPTPERVTQAEPSQSRDDTNNLEIVYPDDVGEYVNSILLPNERVLAIARIHWMIYLLPIILGIIAVGGSLFSLLPSIGMSSVTSSRDTAAFTLASFALCGLPFGVLAIYGFVRAFLLTKFTEFAVTDKRVIGKFGIIKRSSLELVLGKVESISVNQNLFGRIFNYGTVVVTGSGGTHQPIPYIADPMKMKQAINTILAK
jgi:Bacterial PH domain